jgi:hypothetical protein
VALGSEQHVYTFNIGGKSTETGAKNTGAGAFKLLILLK